MTIVSIYGCVLLFITLNLTSYQLFFFAVCRRENLFQATFVRFHEDAYHRYWRAT